MVIYYFVFVLNNKTTDNRFYTKHFLEKVINYIKEKEVYLLIFENMRHFLSSARVQEVKLRKDYVWAY